MKKTLIGLTTIMVLLNVFFIAVLKFPMWQIGAAIDIATGLSAKLGCSGHFISQFPRQRILDDLATYSPATGLVELAFDEANQVVTASLFGSQTIAKFRPGVGCTLEFGDTSELDNLLVKPTIKSTTPRLFDDQQDFLEPKIQNRVEQILQQDNENGDDTRALLVIKDGKLVAEAYGQGITADTPLLGWSMAKSVTAMMIGNLVQQGKLNIDQTHLFPQWQNDERNAISLEHLLTMTSGLAFNEIYTPGSDSTKMLFSAHSASNVALTLEAKYQPGSEFNYSSGTTNILARLVFDKVGASAQANYDFFQNTFVTSLGLDNFWFETDGSGVFIGSSYIYATARDWGKLGLLMLNEGYLNNTQFYSREFAAKFCQPNSSDNDPRYGYQTWLNTGGDELRWSDLPKDACAMMGNRSQVVMVIPSENTVIVRLGWTPGRYDTNARFSRILHFQ